MKKNILIYTYNLDIGGIERSLIALLNSIDYEKYNVDLYMFKHEGEFMKNIPKSVNILGEDRITAYAGIPIIDVFKRGNLYIGFGRLRAKLMCLFNEKILHKKVSGEYISQITYPLFGKKMKKLKKHYNIGISFYWPHYFVKENVNANIKLGWIHTDYSKIFPNYKRELEMWDGIDYVVAVSEECKNTFLKYYPELGNKTIVIENILSEKYIRDEAEKLDVNKEMDLSNNVICSIGRFCEAKNFVNIPQVCRIILDKGIDIKWYLIGYGPDENKIRQAIKENNVEDNVIILGKKENPYPYIKACDIYVQPSKYEGKCVSVREAQILCKPVLITNYETAPSQVINGKDGIIVDLDNNSIAEGIIKIIEENGLRKSLINYCKENHFDNEDEIKKIESFI